MKIEIWNEEKSVKEEPLRLQLRQVTDGVTLIAVDEHGKRIMKSNLLCIMSNGKLELCDCINGYLGLKLDHFGRLEINE